MKEKGIGKSRGSPYLGGKALEHPRDPTYSFQGLLVPIKGTKALPKVVITLGFPAPDSKCVKYHTRK